MAQIKSKKEKKLRVLWVEGRWKSDPEFVPAVEKKGFKIDIASSGKEALERLDKRRPTLVIVDAASMKSSGTRICNSLREKINDLPILLIREEGMLEEELDCANAVLSLPFTSRKLINRMKPLLPAKEEDLYIIGPIHLDTVNHHVRCNGRKTALTPRLMHLLQMLMEKPGDVIERETLFKKVWNTEYTGDTRTLDVHISWLRQAIEADPKKPELLVTQRGVGYKLALDPKTKRGRKK
jgi:DNA-binding response OmpR family regulator